MEIVKNMKAAAFLDRDGVINENSSDYVTSWQEFVFLPQVFEPLKRLARSDLFVVVVTNQSAVNRGFMDRTTLEEIHARMVEEVARRGGRIDAVLYCPHRPDEGCDCRKPRLGLFLRAAKEYNLDLTRSYLVGDALTDVEAGLAVGCKSFLVLTGRGQDQLAKPQARQLTGYHVVANLGEAVEWILGRG